MGKHKHKKCNESVEKLSERLRKLERSLYKRSRRDLTDDYSETGSSRNSSKSRSPHDQSRRSRTRSSRSRRSRTRSSRRRRSKTPRRELSYSCSPTPTYNRGDNVQVEEHGGANTEDMAVQMSEVVAPDAEITLENYSLPAAIEGLLGQEGEPSISNSIILHESLAKRWLAILQDGLNIETKSAIIKKHDSPKNCELLVPPKLNEEVAAAMNPNGINRDKGMNDQQTTLAAAITAIGKVLNGMISSQENVQNIETLSDSARLLCGLYHETTNIRRSLILPGLNRDVKEIMEKTPVSEFLFGDKLQDKVNACKAVKKSAQELKSTPVHSKPTTKTNTTLNYRGPQRRQVLRPSGQKPKLSRAAYQSMKPMTNRPRRSPRMQGRPRRQDHRRR